MRRNWRRRCWYSHTLARRPRAAPGRCRRHWRRFGSGHSRACIGSRCRRSQDFRWPQGHLYPRGSNRCRRSADQERIGSKSSSRSAKLRATRLRRSAPREPNAVVAPFVETVPPWAGSSKLGEYFAAGRLAAAKFVSWLSKCRCPRYRPRHVPAKWPRAGSTFRSLFETGWNRVASRSPTRALAKPSGAARRAFGCGGCGTQLRQLRWEKGRQ